MLNDDERSKSVGVIKGCRLSSARNSHVADKRATPDVDNARSSLHTQRPKLFGFGELTTQKSHCIKFYDKALESQANAVLYRPTGQRAKSGGRPLIAKRQLKVERANSRRREQ